MAFVKLDAGILDSTLWADRDGRDVFVTGLLMATPWEVRDPVPELAIRSLEPTGWSVPGGWYGFIPAAGAGIIRRAGVDHEAGLAALERLAAPDPESRSLDFGGRRMVRVDGGFLVLNFMRFRDRDTGAASRMRALRDRKRSDVTPNVTPVRPNTPVTPPNVTQAEGRGQSTEVLSTSVPTVPADAGTSPAPTGNRMSYPAEMVRKLCYPPDGQPPEGHDIGRDLQWWKAKVAKGESVERIIMALEGAPQVMTSLAGVKWSPAKVFSKGGDWVNLYERAVTARGRQYGKKRAPTLIGQVMIDAQRRAAP